jgi:hypothetical protein
MSVTPSFAQFSHGRVDVPMRLGGNSFPSSTKARNAFLALTALIPKSRASLSIETSSPGSRIPML